MRGSRSISKTRSPIREPRVVRRVWYASIVRISPSTSSFGPFHDSFNSTDWSIGSDAVSSSVAWTALISSVWVAGPAMPAYSTSSAVVVWIRSRASRAADSWMRTSSTSLTKNDPGEQNRHGFSSTGATRGRSASISLSAFIAGNHVAGVIASAAGSATTGI